MDGEEPAHHHDEPDHHHVDAAADQRILAVTLGLIVAYLAVELVVALLAHSLVLLADAGHMVTDAAAIAGAIAAARLAARPASGKWTFGLKRAEILSAGLNGVTLVAMAALVVTEAVRRLLHPHPVLGPAVLVVAVVGLLVNVMATTLLHRADRTSMNVQGVFQHVLTDLYGFAGTVVAGIVIVTTGFTRADSIASLLVAGLMLRAAWGLLRDSGRILLEATPEGFDLAAVRAHMLETPHVTDVHDLHAWTVTSRLPALSAHVVVADCCFVEGHAPQILDQLQDCLAGHFDVEHSTLQLELAGHSDHERDHGH